MANNRAVRAAGRTLAATLLAVALSGTAGAVAAAPTPGPAGVGDSVPARADQVRETGSWASHGYTLDLLSDGTGGFAVWHGAFDGTRVQFALIPAPGPATVAEVTAVEQVGAGALGPDERPGVGGLVTIAFGPTRTAHVEWTSGPRRLAAELCPVVGLDAREMAELGCGA